MKEKNVHRLDNLAVIKYPVFLFLVFSLGIIKGIETKDPDHTTCLSWFKMKIKEQSEGSLEGRDLLSLSLPPPFSIHAGAAIATL